MIWRINRLRSEDVPGDRIRDVTGSHNSLNNGRYHPGDSVVDIRGLVTHWGRG